MYLMTHLNKYTNLKTCQAIEDADTLIFLTALSISEQSGNKFIVVETDVDLAALIIDLISKISEQKHTQIFLFSLLKILA